MVVRIGFVMEVDIYDTIRYFNNNSHLHREDGPAVEYVDGVKKYWYNGIYYPEIETDKEWVRFIQVS